MSKDAISVLDFYKKSLPAQVQLAEKMRKRGQRVDNGTRLEYVISEGSGHTAMQYQKLESFEYFKNHSDILKLDYMYYLKLMTNPLDQVLNVFFIKDTNFKKDFVLQQYKFRLLRMKMLKELKNLFSPNLIFID